MKYLLLSLAAVALIVANWPCIVAVTFPYNLLIILPSGIYIGSRIGYYFSR